MLCQVKSSTHQLEKRKRLSYNGSIKGEMKMENTEYIMSSLDEYFDILDKENKKRSELVAKSLVKYLQKTKEASKFQTLQMAK